MFTEQSPSDEVEVELCIKLLIYQSYCYIFDSCKLTKGSSGNRWTTCVFCSNHTIIPSQPRTFSAAVTIEAASVFVLNSQAQHTHTIESSIVRFNVDCSDLSVLYFQNEAFGSLSSKNGCSVPSKIKCLCEFDCWVSEESDLHIASVSINYVLKAKVLETTNAGAASWIKGLGPGFCATMR